MAHATTHIGRSGTAADEGDPGPVLTELISALRHPGAIDAGYAAQLAEQLTLLLEHHRLHALHTSDVVNGDPPATR